MAPPQILGVSIEGIVLSAVSTAASSGAGRIGISEVMDVLGRVFVVAAAVRWLKGLKIKASILNDRYCFKGFDFKTVCK